METEPRQYKDVAGNPVTLDWLVKNEPEWAANQIRHRDKLELAVNPKVSPITVDDVTRECDRNYDLGRKHAKEEMKPTLEQLKADNAKLRKALVGLVGADGAELDGMEALIRISPHAPDEDRAVTINAIHALRETK